MIVQTIGCSYRDLRLTDQHTLHIVFFYNSQNFRINHEQDRLNSEKEGGKYLLKFTTELSGMKNIYYICNVFP